MAHKNKQVVTGHKWTCDRFVELQLACTHILRCLHFVRSPVFCYHSGTEVLLARKIHSRCSSVTTHPDCSVPPRLEICFL